MRSLPVSRPAAVVVLLAVTTGAIVVGAVVATPAGATASASTTDSGTSTQQTVDAMATPPENLSVTVEVPSTVVANASQNYAVSVDGADGNVTTTWTFEGETERGERVTHAFAEDGNASIEVTIIDEGGATVTRTLQVTVVEFGDDDDRRDPLKNVATMGLVIVTFIGMKAFLFLYVFPNGMRTLTDAL